MEETHIGVVQQINVKNDRTTVIFACNNGEKEELNEEINFFNKAQAQWATWFNDCGIKEGQIAAIKVEKNGDWIKGLSCTVSGIISIHQHDVLIGTVCTTPRHSFGAYQLSIPIRVKEGNCYQTKWVFAKFDNLAKTIKKGQQIAARIKNIKNIFLKDGSQAISCQAETLTIYG